MPKRVRRLGGPLPGGPGIYVALAVTCEGTREVLGLWAGEHGDGEGAKYWLKVLTEIKNRHRRQPRGFLGGPRRPC